LKDPAFLDGLANEIAYGLALALGLKKKVTPPKVLDPCKNCQTVADLKAEIDRLRAAYQGLMQDLKRVGEITARYKI